MTQQASKSPIGQIAIAAQGIFWAGGEVVVRAGRDSRTRRNHAYVEYFIPKGAAGVPIVLAHANLPGTIWRTRPDGGEGWAEYFLRQGYPVFVVDPPGTGRAGFQIDAINGVGAGGDPGLKPGSLASSDSSAWQRWNIGPEFGKAAEDCQFPTDAAALAHFLGVLSPAQTIVQDAVDAAFVAVLERVSAMAGPAVFIGWSVAGGLGQRLAIARPELLRGLVVLEGAKGCPPYPSPQSWFDACHEGAPDAPTRIVEALARHHLPLLNINGEAGHASNSGHSRLVGQTLVDALNAAGGDATSIFLPDEGIRGSSHMFFWERNSDAIAGLVNEWLQAKAAQ